MPYYKVLIPKGEDHMSNMTLNDAWQHYATVKDQSHGTAHIQAVLDNALELAKHYPKVNKRDVEYAAILHDIGHQAQTRTLAHGGHGVSTYHPIIGVGIAQKYITDLPAESQTAILDAVRHHHGPELPQTDVGRIVRDADRLASTGNPATLANRAFLYRVAKSPNQDVDATARSAYKYLRTKKLNRLQSRMDNAFLTAEGRQLFDTNVKNINSATDSYEKFTRLLDVKGVNPVYTSKTAGVLNKLKSFGSALKGEQYKGPSVNVLARVEDINSRLLGAKHRIGISSKNIRGYGEKVRSVTNDIHLGDEAKKRVIKDYADMAQEQLAQSTASKEIIKRLKPRLDKREALIANKNAAPAKARAALGVSVGLGAYALSNDEKTAGIKDTLKNFVANVKGRKEELAGLKRVSDGLKGIKEKGRIGASASIKTIRETREYAKTNPNLMRFEPDHVESMNKSHDILRAAIRADRATADATNIVHKAVNKARTQLGAGVAGVSALGAGAYALSGNDKTAGVMDYLATVKKDDAKTRVRVRHDNNMVQDAYHAFQDRNIDDEFHQDRMKVLAGTAAAALGAGILLYNRGNLGKTISDMNENPARTPLMNSVARRVGPVLTAAGLYGAYRHKDDEDKTSRNIALGVAGLGVLGTSTIGKGAYKSTVSDADRAAILKKVPVIFGGGALVGAGLIHSTNAAQKMDDDAKVKELLQSKEDEAEVAHKVNSIREKKNVASRYPLTRIFNTVPILENAPHYSIGIPSDELSPEDKALYIKYQKQN